MITTSALLVGLPLALAIENETMMVQQEKEMLAQQQGAQQVRLTFFLFPPFASSSVSCAIYGLHRACLVYCLHCLLTIASSLVCLWSR